MSDLNGIHYAKLSFTLHFKEGKYHIINSIYPILLSNDDYFE